MRRFLAAVILLTGVLGPGWAAAQGQNSLVAGFRDYFAATARNAAQGARNEAVRRRQVTAALSPLVTQFLVQRPGQISPMIQGLNAAAPDVAPAITRRAMAAFPGFANQIAVAAGQGTAPIARSTGQSYATPPATGPRTARQQQQQRQIDAHGARVAAWAVSAIAQNSGALEQIMAQAMAAVPGGETMMVRAVQAAFPGFAPRIATATGIQAAMAAPPVAPQPIYRAPAEIPVKVRAVRAPSVPKPITQPVAVQPIIQKDTRALQVAAPAPAAPLMRLPAPLPKGLRLADSDDYDGEINDPLEPMNRIFFAFNETIDLVLLRPIAIGYNFVTPDPVIDAVRRFFLNLDGPVIFANDLLQGDFADAGVTLGRFGVNSTIGFLGLFDPAASFGWERHHADFGQTLYAYDIGAGPYLVLPLLGPVSTRGGVGKVVDIFFQPLTYLLTSGQNLAVAASRAVVKREELLEPLDQLRENSVDYYTGLKAAYWQARQVELNKGALEGLGGGGGGNGGADKLFDATN